MTGGLFVISECMDSATGKSVWKRTDALDGVSAIGLCARLDERGIYSRIVAACERYQQLPIVVDWDKFAADWFQQPASRKFYRAAIAYRSLA